MEGQMKECLQLGPLLVTFHKTIRVKMDESSALPPNLGYFKLFKVSDYDEVCPASWCREAYFIGMHETEAMWMNFQTVVPIAICVGGGGINVLTGEDFKMELQKDNYMVSPPQPWLDGWKNKDGSVSQFLSTVYGERRSVGEQLTECESGCIEIGVFENKKKLKAKRKPEEIVVCGFGCSEMGLGKGGKIEQKIYPDPYGIDVWHSTPMTTAKLYLIHADQFEEITGKEMPKPISIEEYNGVWYDLKDDGMEDIEGSDKFENLDSAFKNSLDKDQNVV